MQILAALYWRAQGNLANGIECLRCAVQGAPRELSDVPLANLAALLYKLDDVDGALKLARAAHEVDSVEASERRVWYGTVGSGVQY